MSSTIGVHSAPDRDSQGKATGVRLMEFRSAPMRAFHLSWIAFFLCFIAWFGVAPLMAVIRDDLKLTKAQIGNAVIASVAITILARIVAGWLCDRMGARRTYTALLLLGSLPVMGIGLSHSYQSFLLFRLAIGVVGASFVITQHHTSTMFSTRVVGTANAITAGWGNLGGGVTQWLLPLLFGAIVGAGVDRFVGWRLAMVIPGLLMLATGAAYYFLTEDTPDGRPFTPSKGIQALREAMADHRVWLLFVVYGACFGIEITADNVAALYFRDNFHTSLKVAGLLASLLGMMNIFARALGGIVGDWTGNRWGFSGRTTFLGAVLLAEGLALALFSRLTTLAAASAAFVFFGLFVCMACGATYAVVPLIRPRSIGSVSGIVGAGGNAGAVLASTLFKSENISGANAFFYLGIAISICAFCAVLVRPSRVQAFEPTASSFPELEPQPAE